MTGLSIVVGLAVLDHCLALEVVGANLDARIRAKSIGSLGTGR